MHGAISAACHFGALSRASYRARTGLFANGLVQDPGHLDAPEGNHAPLSRIPRP
jgi:hypothetical protein